MYKYLTGCRRVGLPRICQSGWSGSSHESVRQAVRQPSRHRLRSMVAERQTGRLSLGRQAGRRAAIAVAAGRKARHRAAGRRAFGLGGVCDEACKGRKQCGRQEFEARQRGRSAGRLVVECQTGIRLLKLGSALTQGSPRLRSRLSLFATADLLLA